MNNEHINLSFLIQTIRSRVSYGEAAFSAFRAVLSQVKLQPQEIWEPAGQIGRYVGFVNNGVLRQYAERDGIEYTDTFYLEGEFLGNFESFLTQEPAWCSLQALETSELIVMPFVAMQQLYDQFPVIDRFGRLIAEQKLMELHYRTRSFLMDSPEERYRQLMIRQPALLGRVKQYYIAQYLGVKPESLSRIRQRMTKG